ncbi:chromate transporter [Deinococcus aquiradiocola]|uniref:Chromate transporter n=1 Tax=Deinococcus aquiradiocola TaxID=393059 RepID=A0A917US67_9DEIO|nr:chromate transporter [Deinococcus aquiradiocola]GGJ82002.1 hypothetical protein GCM10008939_27390 [Deinococcus aquiradiocola]
MSSAVTVFVEFVRLGFLSVGAVNLAAMGQVVVENHHWLTHEQFVQGYALGQLLPGPNILSIILYGHAAAGMTGGIAALLGFFVPPAGAVVAAYVVTQRGSPVLARLYRALLPIGAGLLLAGLAVLARGSVTGPVTALIAVAAFVVTRATRVPPVLAVLTGLALGALLLH